MLNQYSNKGLGRLPQPDSRNIKLADFTPILPPPKTKMWSMFYRELDQGDTGTCVGHGGKHWELTSPVIQTKPSGYPTALDMYNAACLRDQWTENDDRNAAGHYDFGSSVLGLMKALQKDFHFIEAYAWAENADQLASFVSYYSPAVIGINWYSSMFDVDHEGFVRITPNAYLAGGHCIAIRGYNKKKGAFRFPQSWGNRFGLPMHNGELDGAGWMDGETMDRLIREDGEAALPIEVRVKAAMTVNQHYPQTPIDVTGR